VQGSSNILLVHVICSIVTKSELALSDKLVRPGSILSHSSSFLVCLELTFNNRLSESLLVRFQNMIRTIGIAVNWSKKIIPIEMSSKLIHTSPEDIADILVIRFDHVSTIEFTVIVVK